MARQSSSAALTCFFGLCLISNIYGEVPDKSLTGQKLLRDRLAPKCDNFLKTVLHGRWFPKQAPSNVNWKERREMQTLLKRKEEELNEVMRFVWKKKGIPPNPWKSTTVCGYYRLRRATKLRPSIGTWCDPNGPTPCCSNVLYGRCVPKNRLNDCRCSQCANVQYMKHAEIMDWKPHNAQCKWHQYTPAQACEVIETSPVKELYFVGDSYLYNMYSSMLMVLTGKPITGSYSKTPMTDEQRELCSNYGTGYWLPCRSVTRSLDQMLHRDSLCGDGRNVTFKMELKKYYSVKFGNDFKELVRSLLGKKGAYLVVGIGFHVKMRSSLAIDQFMQPAVDLVNSYYEIRKRPSVGNRWPRFMFSLPLDYGILKPTRFLRGQYVTKQRLFERDIANYCNKNSIPILNFNPLVKDVISFDGIHYGVGVNIAKSQILLNYFASLSDSD